LWPIFLLLGRERVRIAPGMTVVTPLDFVSYLISHSLLADIGWASLLAGLYLIYLANVLGPPPPSLKALKIGALCGWLFVPWFYWIDRHRPAISIAESGTDTARE
jgi:hypothetical protein